MNSLHVVEQLRQGHEITVRPHGNSMTGRINSGDAVRIAPATDREVNPGDAVFVKVHGRYYVHLVKAKRGDQYLIGNNRGGINGWTNRQSIYGVVISVE